MQGCKLIAERKMRSAVSIVDVLLYTRNS